MSVLGALDVALSALGISYEFGEWSDTNVPQTYWTGEYFEEPNDVESGLISTEFVLTGVTRGKFSNLEMEKELIRRNFQHGFRFIMVDGTGVHVAYNNATMIPTDDENLHRIEVSLDVKQWRAE